MKPHILVIDDSETAREAIASVLPKRDYALTMVANGTDGLSYLEQNVCDLIVLDYSLPDTNGLNLLHTLVKKCPLSQIFHSIRASGVSASACWRISAPRRSDSTRW